MSGSSMFVALSMCWVVRLCSRIPVVRSKFRDVSVTQLACDIAFFDEYFECQVAPGISRGGGLSVTSSGNMTKVA